MKCKILCWLVVRCWFQPSNQWQFQSLAVEELFAFATKPHPNVAEGGKHLLQEVSFRNGEESGNFLQGGQQDRPCRSLLGRSGRRHREGAKPPRRACRLR